MNSFDMHLRMTAIFLKKFLFKVSYKTREYAMLNHKNGKFCTVFSLYKNEDMSIK